MNLFIDLLQAVFIGVGGWSMVRRILRNGSLGFFVPQWLKKRRETPKPEAPEKYQKYGHPFAPVPTLHDALPKPPGGHAWEIVVEPSSNLYRHETLMLVCRLMDLATSIEVSSHRADLVYEYGECLWSDEYRKYGRDYAERSAKDKFVRDFVTWANKQLAAFQRQTFTGGEYMMKGA